MAVLRRPLLDARDFRAFYNHRGIRQNSTLAVERVCRVKKHRLRETHDRKRQTEREQAKQLEPNLRAELDLPRCFRASDGAKARDSERLCRLIKVRMVHDVKRLGPELDGKPLRDPENTA